MKELPLFTHLEKLELNLKGIGFYTEILDRNLQDMTQAGNNTLIYTEDSRQVWRIHKASYIYTNDHLPILNTLMALKSLFKTILI
ncbi:MAG: hypothetical protein HWD61_08480 [Parachlamydiaceae bacterium]|nr:MAG: hypothetical protein HWD61_08480 [Parachlamydiaceae bacterium]